jgi:hypothetical protein
VTCTALPHCGAARNSASTKASSSVLVFGSCGNVTGLSLQQIELAKKRLQILTDALPSVQAATMFWDSWSEDQWKATSSAVGPFGLQLAGVQLQQQPYNYEAALTQAPPGHRSTLMPVSPAFYRDRERLADFAFRHKIASMFGLREWGEALNVAQRKWIIIDCDHNDRHGTSDREG